MRTASFIYCTGAALLALMDFLRALVKAKINSFCSTRLLGIFLEQEAVTTPTKVDIATSHHKQSFYSLGWYIYTWRRRFYYLLCYNNVIAVFFTILQRNVFLSLALVLVQPRLWTWPVGLLVIWKLATWLTLKSLSHYYPSVKLDDMCKSYYFNYKCNNMYFKVGLNWVWTIIMFIDLVICQILQTWEKQSCSCFLIHQKKLKQRQHTHLGRSQLEIYQHFYLHSWPKWNNNPRNSICFFMHWKRLVLI